MAGSGPASTATGAVGASSQGFEAFAAAHGATLHRIAWVLTRHEADAEDLTQTTLTKAWRAWPRIEGEPLPYARRILAREFISSRRRRWWGEQPSEVLPETATSADWADGLTLTQAIAALPRAQRAVVVLRYLEDLSVEDTAIALGVSPGTVKSHLSRALRALRVSPELTDDEPPVPPMPPSPTIRPGGLS